MDRSEGSPSEGGQAAGQPVDRGEYLGFVAHEVRNPLSTALWSAELLARMPAEERSGSRGEKLTQMCMRSLGRVRQLVEDHFLCERLDAHGIHTRPERIVLRELVAEIGGRRALELAQMELEIPPDLAVGADRVLLDRALDALLAMAGRERAPVRVRATAAAGGQVEIRVEGADPGPDPLGDPRKGAQGDARGRSLALPMARRIAAVLGGALRQDGAALVLEVPGDGVVEPVVHP
jgi:signal transduction histidine kinase